MQGRRRDSKTVAELLHCFASNILLHNLMLLEEYDQARFGDVDPDLLHARRGFLLDWLVALEAKLRSAQEVSSNCCVGAVLQLASGCEEANGQVAVRLLGFAEESRM